MLSELLSTLRSLDIKVWVEGEQLRVSTPKGALSPELRQQIAENKTEIICFLQQSGDVWPGVNVSIPCVDHTGDLPLSSAQQRMWFLDQLNQSNSAYNLFFTEHIRSLVDTDIFEQCLHEVVRRHSILRTVFKVVQGEPRQQILPPAPFTMPVVDLQLMPDATRKHEVDRLVAQETDRPFDLTNGPLFRTLMLRIAPDDYLFVMAMHHIISDGVSINVIEHELAVLYSAFASDLPSPLPDLPIQYADFAVWQQTLLQGELMETQLDYWMKILGNGVPKLELSLDHPRSDEDTSKGSRQSLILPSALTNELIALAQREHVTLFMVMLAVFALLLHRLSGQEEIVLGTPVAGRNRPELEPLVGLFLNTLVLKTDLSGNPSFRTLLQRVAEVTLGAYANQDLPFERLVEELHPDRNLHRNPLFDVLVNFFSRATSMIDDSGLGWNLLDISEQDAKLPITFYIEQYRDQIGLRVAFQPALFSPQRIRCLLEQYEYLLQQVIVDQTCPIHSYSLVTPASRDRLPDATQPLEEPVQEVITTTILRWGKEHPELPAIVHGAHCWSYEKLASRALTVARMLVAKGCAAGDVVAVTGRRSFDLIACLIGAWLGGGVLLSIDPNLPPMRQQVMIDEAGVKWILAVGALTVDATWQERGITPLLIDDLTGDLTSEIAALDDSPVTLPTIMSDQPAYIFFTSGTTNVPKGVVGVHKGLSHFLQWQRTTFAIGPDDRAAQLTGLSFDVMLRDIFMPLTSGAALYLPDDEHLLGSGRIITWLNDKGITLFHAVPGIMQTWLIDAPGGVTLDHLRWIFVAGEPLNDALVRIWRNDFGASTKIVNLYGPTETTMAKLFYCVPEVVEMGVQPIGRPLPQTQALILRPGDAKGAQLCGVGELGEIVIRTPFRTLGYLNAPAEQAKRFVPNPFRNDPADLVYYTGDMGRYRLDGSIDFLGRVDDQVKIQGVRIELGELNAALLAHPSIKAGIVVPRPSERQGYLLSAYVVLAKDTQLSASDLRRYLAERFPAAMVPSAYAFLDALPLNANGKIDRRALPTAITAQTATDAVIPPHDLTEARLLQIWQGLLKVSEISVEDDFFALGGHSLLVVRMLAQIDETFHVHLPLTSLFVDATIKHLAELIEAQIGPTPWSSLVEVQPGGSKTPFYCVHGMTGDIFWFRDLVEYMDSEQPFWGLQSRGLDGIQSPLNTIEEMAALYVEEIRAFQPEGPYFIGGYSYGGSIAYEMARQLVMQGQTVGLLAVIDHATPKSGYYRVEFGPSFLINYSRNLPYRVRDFFRRRPDQILARVLRQWRLTKKRFSSVLASGQNSAQGVAAGDIIDQAPELPPHVQRLIECNFQAILNYSPGSFDGNLTLLRARGGRLLCNHDPLMGWGKFVDGSIDVRVIPGSHLQLFKKPHVRHLAQELQRCLDEAQAAFKL